MAHLESAGIAQDRNVEVNMPRAERILKPWSPPFPLLQELTGSERCTVLLYGWEATYTMAMRLIAHAVLRQAPVLLVDSANVFDPYLVAQIAVQHHQDPVHLLTAIRLARTFTCHQLRDRIKRLPVCTRPSRTLLVILGPCTPFFDEDVPQAEAAAVFQRIKEILRIQRRCHPLLLVQSLTILNPRRKYFLKDLYYLADRIWKVDAWSPQG